ncbi:unnamed protein product [Angiostrongylus costaricensis]|uniref:Rab3 GTPase-activating protein non-catalytic subunit n=1 Tax=Angiostrongylus costaricensis TaxID=334426 RepID=A0A0R3PLL8_ANGCS|nr:unnamed protein product [Angiostrongylus costaricensis]
MVTYNSMDYVLLVNQQRLVLRIFELVMVKIFRYIQDFITCGCLFGLGTHRISETLDCLIVTLGMSNGHIVFFTEKGTLLYFEKFSESDILSVSFDQTEYVQQLTVVSTADFFAVDPVSMHSTLLKAKTAIAKGEKSADQLSSTLELDVDRLKPEKGNHGLRHVLFTGIHRQSAFEQYLTASMSYKRATWDMETISSTTPPQYFTYMYTSDRVFSTFAWTTESDKKRICVSLQFVPHLGIRNMFGISSTPRKKAVMSQNAHVITTRGTLGDSRLAVAVATEVTRGLIAVVDHIARVMLIDVPNRQIIRIWKGYRDAAVAWVTSTNGSQTALFLSIFAPRRALLEVWNVQNGVRVGALHVDAAGVLLDGGLAPVLCGSQNARYERNAFFVDTNFVSITSMFHILFPGKADNIILKTCELCQRIFSRAGLPPYRVLGIPYYFMLGKTLQVAEFAAREKWDANQLEERMSRLDIIEQLRSLLPNTLNSKFIRCDIAWELMSQWYRDTSQNFDNFELAMRYVEVVDDARLRHGVLVLIWQNFVLERFKATILLIEKTGRAPKERESRQQLQIPEVRVVDFLSRCHEMLKMLMDDVRDAPPPSHIQRDHLIEVTLVTVSNPTALNLDAFLAIRQSLVNYHLVLHHYHLAIAATVQLSAGLRNHILRVLFCPIGQRAFFLPLDSHPLIPLDRVDDTIMERRHQFIAKQVLCLLRAGQDSAASREMAGVVHSDKFIQTMTRLLAARALRLAEEQKTVLTSAHLRFVTRLFK